MKLAAIDIGSNAVRLLIVRPLKVDKPNTKFKVVELSRLPLRLGDDVFNYGYITEKKADLFFKTMKAFSYFMEVYNVDLYRACATSAMRDAKNASEIIKRVENEIGISIDIISGMEESEIILASVMDQIPDDGEFIHIDVGGGSTEIAHIKNHEIKKIISFNIGTVRMRENKIEPSEWKNLYLWLNQLNISKTNEILALGTGGNIVKLIDLAIGKSKQGVSFKQLEATNAYIETLSHEQRVYELKLNPDRAQVITYAGNIFLEILKSLNIKEIWAPESGLKDGIIKQIWKNYCKQNKIK